MPTSLFAPDFQAVLDQAKETSGLKSGPFPSPEDWRYLGAFKSSSFIRGG